MKKRNVIILSILLILTLIVIYLYVDYTRIIENVTDYSVDQKWAYSLEDTKNEVIFTLYQKFEPQVKNITIYKIENNVVKSINYEQHYINKLNALYQSTLKNDNTTNVKVKDNVVFYSPINSGEIGITKDALMETLSGLEKIYIKIDK